MNNLSRTEKIKFIKSFKEPPFLKNDLYYERSPWPKFGSVSSGICMCWCWYRDAYISATDDEVDMAYDEIKKFYNKENDND